MENNIKLSDYYVDENGLIDGVFQRWFSNGQKRTQSYFIKGLECGLCTEWHNNGSKYMEYNVIDDRINGNLFMWHQNGNKLVEAYYVNGFPDGSFNTFYLNGTKESEQFYVNGNRKYIQYFDKSGYNISGVEFVMINNREPYDNDDVKILIYN